MATIPPPDTIPETPPQPGQAPDEIVPPTPDIDVPDPNPGDPGNAPDPTDAEPEAHPS